MEKIKSYNEFINEGLFSNILGKVGRGLSDWAMAPLKDMMKDISKSGDPKKIIKSLKMYIQKTGESLKNGLKDVKNVTKLQSLVTQELTGVHSALKGVQATQKVNKTFFDEIFKNADSALVKAMKNKKPEKSIPLYVNNLLSDGGGLFKLANYEAPVVQSKKEVKDEKMGETVNYSLKYRKLFEAKEETTEEDLSKDEKFIKLKEVTYKWLVNILKPIMNGEAGEEEGGDYISFDDNKYKMKRQAVQDMVSKSDFKSFKTFRDTVGNEMDYKIQK